MYEKFDSQFVQFWIKHFKEALRLEIARFEQTGSAEFEPLRGRFLFFWQFVEEYFDAQNSVIFSAIASSPDGVWQKLRAEQDQLKRQAGALKYRFQEQGRSEDSFIQDYTGAIQALVGSYLENYLDREDELVSQLQFKTISESEQPDLENKIYRFLPLERLAIILPWLLQVLPDTQRQ